MTDTTAVAYGVLPLRISLNELRSVLVSCGLTPSLDDSHHVSVKECSHFLFREDGEGAYVLSADAESAEELIKDTELVSSALSKREIKHSFEVYDAQDRLVRKFAVTAA